MDIRFVPTFKAIEALHDRVLGLDDVRDETLPAMLLELSSDELDVSLGVAETVRGAVQRDDTMSGSHVIEHRFFLFRRKRGQVGENNQPLIRVQNLGGQTFNFVCVDKVNALSCKNRLNLPKAIVGFMVPIVA